MSDAPAFHRLIQWFSPAFALGAFAYSHGLEQVITDGAVASGTSLECWLRDILHHGAGRNDGILLALASRASEDELSDIAALARAFVCGKERLRETEEQGRAFAKATGGPIPPDPGAPMPYPVAVGAAARRYDLPLEACLRHYLHGFTANLVSVAVRFIPLGQTDGQRVLAALFDDIDAIAQQVMSLGADDLGGAVLGADLAAMRHETLSPRIFQT